MEMIVILGILTALVGIAIFTDVNNFRGNAFRAEQSMLVTILQTARADALNNTDQQPHGVAIHPPDHPNSYVMFEGLCYTGPSCTPTATQIIGSSYTIGLGSGSPTEIVFSQLSADVDSLLSVPNQSATITVIDPQRPITSTITINKEGAISL